MTREELLKTAKPILFNTDMVRAILDGRKTATRRCVKYKYSNTEMKMHTDKYGTRLIEIQKDVEGETFGKNSDGSTWHKLLGYIEPTPPYQPGDILYVRETFVQAAAHIFWYKADDNSWLDSKNMRWKPSIHMPKEAARIFLRVTDVRVERLQDIDIDGIRKEGLSSMAVHVGDMDIVLKEWEILWNSIIKKSDIDIYGWDADPYVWCISFKRIYSEEK